MASFFETVVINMRNMGFFQFLFPFMLSTAIFYGLLRKSKIFGEPLEVVSVNAVVALVASFMVWSAPILLGVNIEKSLTAFFLQGTLATVTVLVGLLMASMFFPPDLAKQLAERLKAPQYASAFLIFGLIIAAAILLSSGMIGIFLPQGFTIGGPGSILSDELVAIIVTVALLIGTALIIMWGGGESKPSSS